MHAGKFGEHERSVRVARGADEGNSSFLSTLQTSHGQVHPYAKSINQFFYNMATATWALQPQLVPTMHGGGKQRSL